MDELEQEAINATLQKKWEKAIALNKQILEKNKNDINAYCRLAFALMQSGKIEKAKQTYRKILALDKFNLIAKKNFDKLNSLPRNYKKKLGVKIDDSSFSPNQFIEEPGKTKSVYLINPAPSSVLSRLCIGDFISLFPKKHSIEARDKNKTYLGALPDDVAFRLLRLIKAGNEYQACIKNVSKNSINIFIKEVKRAKRLLSYPSFPNFSSEKGDYKDIRIHRSESLNTENDHEELEE